MSSQEYELAFYGELAPGADLEDCKMKLGQLFKASPAQIEKMFTGQRVVLKSKLDFANGEKYLAALRARGALCKLESAMAADTPKAEPEELTNAETQTQVKPQPSASFKSPATDPEAAERLNVAGDKVDEVLADIDFSLEPAGVNLADQKDEVELPKLTMQDSLSVAPAGSDLGEKKEEKAPVSPDISHLSLKD